VLPPKEQQQARHPRMLEPIKLHEGFESFTGSPLLANSKVESSKNPRKPSEDQKWYQFSEAKSPGYAKIGIESPS
jgi:hypothetical protein